MSRKLSAYALISIMGALFACTAPKTEISGTLEGGSEKTLILERLDVNQTTGIDTLRTSKEGNFRFKLRAEEPELFVLKNEEGGLINLLAAPGDRIRVYAETDDFGSTYQVEGSVESEGIRQLVVHLDQTRHALDSLQAELNRLKDDESPQWDLLQEALARTIIKQKRFTIQYLVEHMNSLSSVYALYQKYNEENLVLGAPEDLQYFKAVADSLESKYPSSSLTLSLRADIQQREAAFKQQAQLSELLNMADEVSGTPSLSLPDRDGQEIPLSSLKGQVVLVVFWASANEQSVQALLRLKSTYERYRQKGFEVYAVSLDNNKVNWMGTVDYNEFSWINVSELSTESRAALIFNVQSLPTTFLINREGDIVARNLLGRTLETWLDNLI